MYLNVNASSLQLLKTVVHLAGQCVLAFTVLTVMQVKIFSHINPPTTAFIQKERIERFFAGDRSRVRYHWRSYQEISEYLPISMVAAEDQRFPTHLGFDLAAIKAAFKHNEQSKSVRGGSTISQQVAKNLFLWPERGWIRKGLEAWYTLWIELLWSKQRILEVYVNTAQFGDGIYGAEAAAQYFFGKPAKKLTAWECAKLAAVLPSPTRYNAKLPGDYVLARAMWIEKQVARLDGANYLKKK